LVYGTLSPKLHRGVQFLYSQ